MRRVLMLGAVLALSGCGGESEYSDLLEFRDAAVDAGLSCPNWERTSDSTGACSDTTVLILFADADAREEGVADMKKEAEEFKELLGAGVPQTLLAGGNWVINSDDAPDLADDLGGEVLRW